MTTLPDIQAQLADASVRLEAVEIVIADVVLGHLDPTPARRRELLAELHGFQREVEALRKVEAGLIANGRADAEIPQATERRFHASVSTALIAAGVSASSAPEGPREARETSGAQATGKTTTSVLSSAPLPAAGDCF